MWRTDDPVTDFDRYDAEQTEAEKNLPRCEYCGDVIYDSYYEIGGEIICEECLERFKHYVET